MYWHADISVDMTMLPMYCFGKSLPRYISRICS